MPGPITKAVLVNLVLEGRLKERLHEWRRVSSPPLTYERIADIINAELKEIADRYDADTETFSWLTIQRWCTEVYKIETPRRRS